MAAGGTGGGAGFAVLLGITGGAALEEAGVGVGAGDGVAGLDCAAGGGGGGGAGPPRAAGVTGLGGAAEVV